MTVKRSRAGWLGWILGLVLGAVILIAALLLTRSLWSDLLYGLTGEESLPAQVRGTLEWLGNTGSVALPITMAVGIERGFVTQGDNIGMLGIGSGINSVMLATQGNQAQVGTERSLVEAAAR